MQQLVCPRACDLGQRGLRRGQGALNCVQPKRKPQCLLLSDFRSDTPSPPLSSVSHTDLTLVPCGPGLCKGMTTRRQGHWGPSWGPASQTVCPLVNFNHSEDVQVRYFDLMDVN